MKLLVPVRLVSRGEMSNVYEVMDTVKDCFLLDGRPFEKGTTFSAIIAMPIGYVNVTIWTHAVKSKNSDWNKAWSSIANAKDPGAVETTGTISQVLVYAKAALGDLKDFLCRKILPVGFDRQHILKYKVSTYMEIAARAGFDFGEDAATYSLNRYLAIEAVAKQLGATLEIAEDLKKPVFFNELNSVLDELDAIIAFASKAADGKNVSYNV